MDSAPEENTPQGEVVARRSHARKYHVTTQNAYFRRIDEYFGFPETVNRYATALRKNLLIHCYNCEGFVEDKEREDGRLVINISATPLPQSKWRRSEKKIVENVFDIYLGDRSVVYEPSDNKEYFNLYEEDGSTVIAQFSEGSIYILFNLLRAADHDIRLSLFKIILDHYLEYRKAVRKNKLDEYVEANENQRKSNFRRNFGKFYLGEIGIALDNAKAEKAKSENNIIATRDILTSHIKEHKYLQAKVAGFRQLLSSIDETIISKQFDELCLLSATHDIFLDGSRIIVPVGQIDIEHEGVIYDIGEFDVEINTAQNVESITCTNKTRVVCGDYHPHVTASGSVCLGTIEEIIPQLITDMEYAAVVRIMIDFLHAYNPGDPFEEVESWPVKGKEEAQSEPDN